MLTGEICRDWEMEATPLYVVAVGGGDGCVSLRATDKIAWICNIYGIVNI